MVDRASYLEPYFNAFLQFPSSRHLPTPDNEAELAELAKTLLSGSTDTKKLDEISSKINGFMTVQPEPGIVNLGPG